MPLWTVFAVVGLVGLICPPRPAVPETADDAPEPLSPGGPERYEPEGDPTGSDAARDAAGEPPTLRLPTLRLPTLTLLRVPVLGAAAGCVGVLTIAFIANRYLGDLFPLLALLGLAGVQVTANWWRRAQPTRLLAVPLVALGLWGLAANLALAIEYQRLIAPVDPATRSAFVAWQYTIGSPGDEIHNTHVIFSVRRGTIYHESGYFEDCGGFTWADGFSLQPLDPDIVEPVFCAWTNDLPQ
jgi:hypothetical protein